MLGFPNTDDHVWHALETKAIEAVPDPDDVEEADSAIRVGPVGEFVDRLCVAAQAGWDDGTGPEDY